jgi:hypothetical protein
MSDVANQTEEDKTYTLADILQEILGLVQSLDERLTQVCQSHEALDKEIHEDFFQPIHKDYMAKLRGKGIAGLREKYGSKFDPIAEPLQGLGIQDIYERLYDHLEELKQGEGWNDDSEAGVVDGVYTQAMDRIGKIRGKPAEEAPTEPAAAAEEGQKPDTAVEIEVKKEPAKAGPKSPRARSPLMDL